MRLTVALAVSCVLLSGLQAAEDAAAAMTQFTDIPPERLGNALEEFARDRKLQLIYFTNDVAERHSDGAVGNLSAGEALKRLLKGTGMSFQFLDEKTVTVQPVRSSTPESQTGGHLQPVAETSAAAPGARRESTMNSRDIEAMTDAQGLEEIVVSAQKKGDERLLDVPVPITVFDADTLATRDQNRLQDYYATVPGLGFTSFGNGGSQTIALRGLITSAGANPTVSVTVDDIPYGSSTALGSGGVLFPDIDPADLDRIEVLRGPQGTLYGTSSIGGLIRFVTKDPSSDQVTGRIEVLGDAVDHGAQGYGFHGSVNVPLSDTFAIRASGFTRRDPGYVDNAMTGQSDVNRVDVYGGRLSALWRPIEALSVKLGAMLQDTHGYGTPEIDATPDQEGHLHPILGECRISCDWTPLIS
jgi:outer membrane receptor protein involved in Fe transport